MTGHYIVSVEPGFIRVRFPPSVDLLPDKDFFTGMIYVARNSGVSKILYDVLSLTGTVSTLERYNYGSLIADLFRGFQVAFVVNQSIQDPDLFGQKVAVNRGANMRVLTTLSEAYEWLEVKPANMTIGGHFSFSAPSNTTFEHNSNSSAEH